MGWAMGWDGARMPCAAPGGNFGGPVRLMAQGRTADGAGPDPARDAPADGAPARPGRRDPR